jgi:hypothetical protein
MKNYPPHILCPQIKSSSKEGVAIFLLCRQPTISKVMAFCSSVSIVSVRRGKRPRSRSSRKPSIRLCNCLLLPSSLLHSQLPLISSHISVVSTDRVLTRSWCSSVLTLSTTLSTSPLPKSQSFWWVRSRPQSLTHDIHLLSLAGRSNRSLPTRVHRQSIRHRHLRLRCRALECSPL